MGAPDIVTSVAADERYGVAVDRPQILDGRLPAPDAVDEVLVSTAAARLGLRPGSTIRMRLWTPDDLSRISGDPAAFDPHADTETRARALSSRPGLSGSPRTSSSGSSSRS